MKYLHLLLVLMVLPAVLMAQNPQDNLPVDPGYRIGVLDNGLTYYIRHNEEPKDQCCFYIAQKVGSMQEEENQRGLAHLLEHMAFNGSEHFPGGRLIKFLEENGIKFGAELNAYTSLERTVYNIDNVPTNKGEFLIDSCLQILADWSGGVSLLDEEIDKERGVVKSEYIMRNSATMRMYDSILPAVMSDTRYAYRMPIGLMDVVENCPYDALRDYYKKWYHPSYQGIIVVGDIDVDKMENKIKALFSKYRNPDNYAPIVPCVVPDNDAPIFATARDKEHRNTDIEIYFKYDQFPKEKRNTYGYVFSKLTMDLISIMSENRMEELTKKADSPFLYAYAGASEFVLSSYNDAFIFYAQSKPGRELDSYKALLREAVRMSKFGFSHDEFSRAKAQVMAASEAHYKERDKQKNSFYVNSCVNNFLENHHLMSIADDYELRCKLINEVSLDAINKFVSLCISTTGKNMVAFNMSPVNDDQFYFSQDIYRAATQEVFAESIEPLVENKVDGPLIAKLPKAGKITSSSIDNLTGARILKLSNGATVYTKHTDFKDDDIIFFAHSLGGLSLYDAAEERNLKYLDYIMSHVGVGKYSQTDLQKYMAGHIVNLGAFVTLTNEGFSGNCVNKDLDCLMQLVYCGFRTPGSNAEDFRLIQQQIHQAISTSSLDPKSVFRDSLSAFRYNFNPRSLPLSVSDVDNMDFSRMQYIYKERFANAGDFQFFFVGSFDEATLDSLICKYIASLPSSKKRETFRKHTMDINNKYVLNCMEEKMQTPESQVIKYYTVQNVDYTLRNQITFSVISQILSNRYLKTIREDASIAYHSSCRMYFYPNEEPGKADLTLNPQNPLKPEYANRANIMMDSIMTDAVDNGFNQAELDNVRAFMIKNHEEMLRNNSFWLDKLKDHFVNNADFLSDFSEIINSLDVDGLQKSLKDFINSSFVHTYMLIPEGVVQVE